MAFTNPLPALLGMVQGQPDPYQTLLGGYYTPQQAKMAWLGGTLQGIGAGLASGHPGAWAQGAALGGGEGLDNYRKRAVVANQIAMNNQDQAWQNKARAREEAKWGKEDAASQQMSDLINSIQDPQERMYAQLNPEAWVKAKLTPPGGGGSEYGLNPVWGKDAQGNWMLFQPSKGGGAPAQMQFPAGVSPQPQVSFQDLGTSVQPVTTRGAVPVGQPLPKDVAGVAAQQAEGDVKGKAIAAAPADIQAADNALSYIDKIRSDPYLERGTGMSSVGNKVWGTGGYDFQNLVNQAKSGAFLSAIQQMRGMGSLSNAEGDAATAATNRMNTATSKEAFLSALDDYAAIVSQGRARAVQRLSQSPQGIAAPPPATTDLKQKYGLE